MRPSVPAQVRITGALALKQDEFNGGSVVGTGLR